MAQEAHCRAGIHIQRSLQRSIKEPESAQDDPRHGELQPSWVQAMQQTFQLRENTGEGQGIFPGDSGFSILPPHRQTPEFPAGNEAENKKSTLNPELPSEPCSSRQQFHLSVPLPGLLWAPGVLYFPTLPELPHLPRQSWGKWPGDTWQLRPHLQQDSLTFGTLYYFHVMLDWGDQAVLYAPIPWEKKNPAPTRRKLQWLFWFQNYVWNLKLQLKLRLTAESPWGGKSSRDVEMQIPHAQNFWMKAEGAKLGPVPRAHLRCCRRHHTDKGGIQKVSFNTFVELNPLLNDWITECQELKTSLYFSFNSLLRTHRSAAEAAVMPHALNN